MRKLPDMTYDFIRGESYRMSRSGNYDREKHNHDASEKTRDTSGFWIKPRRWRVNNTGTGTVNPEPNHVRMVRVTL